MAVSLTVDDTGAVGCIADASLAARFSVAASQ